MLWVYTPQISNLQLIFVLFSQYHEASMAPVEQLAPLATGILLQAAI